MKSFNKLCRQNFSCGQDAEKALARWIDEQDYIQIFDAKITNKIVYQGRGWPKHNAQGEKVCQMTGQLAISIRKKETKDDENGCFIIATNDIDIKLTMDEFLSHYKSQQSVERGLRFLKNSDFLTSSLFLKKPESIEVF